MKLPLPERGDMLGMVDGRVLLKTSEDWTAGGTTIPAGALLSLELTQFTGGPITPTVLIQPTARQSIEAAATTRDRVIALVLDNVRNRVVLLTPGDKGWTSKPVALPDNASIGLVSTTRQE